METTACSEKNLVLFSTLSRETAVLERCKLILSKKKGCKLLFQIVLFGFFSVIFLVGLGCASSQILQANLKSNILFSGFMFVHFKFTFH